MRITVIGASGRIGGCIMREALRRGHAVTAVVRDGFRGDHGESALPVVRADVFDPVAVAAVLADCDVLVSAVGHAASLDDQGYYERAARSLVQALRGCGTGAPRLLVVGGFGSLRGETGTQLADAGGYPDHAVPEIVGQRDALTYYRTVTDVRWTYISPPPGGIGPGPRTGGYRTARDGLPGRPGGLRVSTEDFAVAVLDEAERAEHLFACLTVASTSISGRMGRGGH
ncbi:MAG TPA: NAD(P)H-binding protein [Micromonosporaceae bacterium]|nr:NAD(P)H-binding protein [Micromonosporaceae bacterium]